MAYQKSQAHRDNAKMAGAIGSAVLQDQREKRVKDYYLNPVLCSGPGCSEVIAYEKKCSNRFCGSRCSALFNASKRDCSHPVERRAKIKKAVLKKSVQSGLRQVIDGEMVFQKVCGGCRKSFVTEKRVAKTCSAACAKSMALAKLDLEKARENGRRSVAEQMAAGKWKPWGVQNKDVRSNPEKYMEGLLRGAGLLSYVFQHQVSCYSIDFAFPDLRIALEVDGKQHQAPRQKAHDKKRDDFLERLGWSVFRVDFGAWKTASGKEKIHQQFKQFLVSLSC